MFRHPFRRLFAILFAAAFFGASTLQVLPAVAMPMDEMMAPMTASMTMVAHDDAAPVAPTPCKGMTPACMTDVGCIFMIGVFLPAAPVVIHLAWAPVSYRWPSVEIVGGRVQAPDLRPPIRLI